MKPMLKKTIQQPAIPFLNVAETARVTGLTQYYLRHELAKGTIPHIKSGRCILINVYALLQQLDVPVQFYMPEK